MTRKSAYAAASRADKACTRAELAADILGNLIAAAACSSNISQATTAARRAAAKADIAVTKAEAAMTAYFAS